jgi:hypothetical protein
MTDAKDVTALRCKCGCTMFLETQQVRGPWVALFDSTDPDNTIDTNLDGLKHITPRRVKCADCGKSHPNPRWKAS